MTRTIPIASIRPTLIGAALTGAATAAALVLVAAIPAAIAAVVVATTATARLRTLNLRRWRGLGLRRLQRLTDPVGTVAARLAPAAAITAITAITAALRSRRRWGLLGLGWGRGLLLLVVAAPTAPAVQAILPRAGGFGRGAAQQRQDHGGRDQTLHFKCSKGPGAGPIAHPLYFSVGLVP